MRPLSNDNILTIAADWHQSGHNLAIAIVIQTWGSSPRPAGSIMIIRDDEQIAGSVSGGCVESAVITAAHDVMARKTSQRLDFAVADADAWQVGLSCGGAISVWVCAASAFENDAAQLFSYVKTQSAQHQMIAIDCQLHQHQMRVASPEQAANLYPTDQCNDDAKHFYLVIPPEPRFYIIGGVHISQHLAPMAIAAGFNTTIIDPRRHFANAERFPNIAIITDWPDEILESANIDEHTAIVTLTHDRKLDDAALQVALGKPAFYIASLGSTRTHAKRCERLKANGFNDDQLARINAPAGLAIMAKTPAEIAVSILAQLIAVYRGKISAAMTTNG